MTHQQYEDLLEKQNYRYAICNSLDNKTSQHDRLFVDHCHVSKKVRGLLCNNCNQGIGLLEDSIENLSQAILYLEKNAKNDNLRD